MGPDADPGKEVALGKFLDFIRFYILDRSFIHNPVRDMACLDQFPQP
jgi:hypothetical protein